MSRSVKFGFGGFGSFDAWLWFLLNFGRFGVLGTAPYMIPFDDDKANKEK